jgi:signal transduction histidine kinase
MDLLAHTEDRRLLFRMAALSLAALLLAAALALAMTVYVNRALADTYAGIVGTVAQKFPQAEAQVVRDLRSPGADSVNLGTQVLGKYGLGDQSADVPNIFNRFYRGENAGENSVGIGLALSKAIFNAQGGDISVHSQRGMGTSFEIRVFRGVA